MSWRFRELELEELITWPVGAKLVFLGVLAGLIYLLSGYFLATQPWRDWQAAKIAEQQLKASLHSQIVGAARLENAPRSGEAIQQQLSQLQQALPPHRQAAHLLEEMSLLAEQEGLILQEFQWQAEREQAQVTELPLQLNVVGNYRQLAQFVAQLLALPRLVSIKQLEIRTSSRLSTDNKAPAPLVMKLSASAFLYLEESAP